MKEILLEEYKVLKSEQLERIKHRDNIVYVLLGAVGTLFSFAIIHKAIYVVAITPMISFVLCWLYLANDRKISEIGTYISEDLSEKLSVLIGEKKVFYWERKHKTYSGRKTRKMIQYIVDLLIFAFPALGGLLMVSTQANSGYIVFLDTLFLIGIIILFIVHYSNKKITHEE